MNRILVLVSIAFSSIHFDSARAQFATVINVPPSTASSWLASNTQLNLFDGGLLREHFSTGNPYSTNANIEVNIYGGRAKYGFTAVNGSTVNISGGYLEGGIKALNGSIANISGGVLNHAFDAESGSQINLSGGDFLLNGQSIPGLEAVGNVVRLAWPTGSTLTGVLADGTPFVFSELADKFAAQTLSLKHVDLPAIGPSQLVSSAGPVPVGIRSGQTLTVDAPTSRVQAGPGSTVNQVEGGVVEFEAIGARVNLYAGEAYGNVFADSIIDVSGGTFRGSIYGATVNLDGGGVEGIVYDGVLNVNDGFLGDNFYVYGGELNIKGGYLYDEMFVSGDATVNFDGGSAEAGGISASSGTVRIRSGRLNSLGSKMSAKVSISGGSISERLYLTQGGEVTLIGDEFVLDGQPLNLSNVGDSLQVQVPEGSVISGLLSDGNHFAFSSNDIGRQYPYVSHDMATGRVILQKAALPIDDRTHFVASTDALPAGLREGQMLTVDAGASVERYFGAGAGSIVVVEQGGVIGYDFQAAGALVNVLGGTIGYNFDVSNGSVVNLDDGEIFSGMDVLGGGTVNVRSGRVGDEAYVSGTGVLNVYDGVIGKELWSQYGGMVNIFGGTIGPHFYIFEGAANISGGNFEGGAYVHNGLLSVRGGEFADTITAGEFGTLRLYGSEFTIDGVPIDEMLLKEGVLIGERNVTLAGIWADGTSFSFHLDSPNGRNVDLMMYPTASLMVFAVPEPTSLGVLSNAGLILFSGLRRRIDLFVC